MFHGAVPVSVTERFVELPAHIVASPLRVAVGNALLVKTTSDVEGVHVPFEIVQRNVALVPAAIPFTCVVGEPVSFMPAEPLTTLQVPVPTVGVFPVTVNVLLLQLV